MTKCQRGGTIAKSQLDSSPGVSPEIMSILIDYTYTGQVTIDVYNVQELVLAADRLSFISMRYDYNNSSLI